MPFGWREISQLERGWTGLVLLLMVVVIILTKSRGAWIALFAVVILEFLLKWRLGWWLILLVALGAVLFAAFSGLPALLEALTTNETLGGFEGRLEIWSRALSMIGDFPFTGIGMGSYVEIVDLFYPHTYFEPGEIVHAHNLFLQIAVDLGLPGVIAWLAIYILVIVAGWRIFKQAKAKAHFWLSAVGAGLLGSQLTLGIHGVTDASTWGIVRTAPLIWALWGLTFAGFYLVLVQDG
jgi:putative inorganic carbon (HCO3(-)) transporter